MQCGKGRCIRWWLKCIGRNSQKRCCWVQWWNECVWIVKKSSFIFCRRPGVLLSVYRIMKWAIKFSSYFTNRRWKSYGEPAGRHAGNMWPLNWIKMIQMKTSIKWTAGTIVITGKVRKKWSEKSGKKELAGIDFGKPMRTVWKSKRAGIASNPLYLLTH